eukprot:gene20838-4014_t
MSAREDPSGGGAAAAAGGGGAGDSSRLEAEYGAAGGSGGAVAEAGGNMTETKYRVESGYMENEDDYGKGWEEEYPTKAEAMAEYQRLVSGDQYDYVDLVECFLNADGDVECSDDIANHFKKNARLEAEYGAAGDSGGAAAGGAGAGDSSDDVSSSDERMSAREDPSGGGAAAAAGGGGAGDSSAGKVAAAKNLIRVQKNLGRPFKKFNILIMAREGAYFSCFDTHTNADLHRYLQKSGGLFEAQFDEMTTGAPRPGKRFCFVVNESDQNFDALKQNQCCGYWESDQPEAAPDEDGAEDQKKKREEIKASLLERIAEMETEEQDKALARYGFTRDELYAVIEKTISDSMFCLHPEAKQ